MTARVQQPAPEFKAQALVNGEFKEVSLSDYKGKYLVLFFYPLDFTFVCPTEILAFADRVQEFRDINTEVVACSVDSQFSHLAWWKTPREEGGIAGVNIPILADVTKQIASDYGVLIENAGVALRGQFIIDPQGVVRTATIHDLPIGRSVNEALRVVQALQFHEEHGDVCPANWEPGGKSMKADPEKSKEYFKTANA